MRVYESCNQVLDYLEGDGLVRSTWLARSSEMSEADFIEEMGVLSKFFREHRPKGSITDLSETMFVVPEDLQQWYSETMADMLRQAGDHKRAYVVRNPFTKEVWQDNVEERQQKDPRVEFFLDSDQALRWVLA